MATDDGIAGSIKQLSEDVLLLVRKELELARQEISEKVKTAGVGAGMLSGSAVTGLLTLGSLTALGIIGLSAVVKPWLAALIVTLFWAVVTGVLAVSGKNRIQDAGGLVPEQTIQSVKDDIEWAKNGAKSPPR